MNQMPTREEYLSLFDLATVRALEFGPADKPWIPAKTPGVRYIDHLSTEELRKKVSNSDFYKPEDLCEINFVNDGRPLAQILGDWVNLDLVAASHVIEHVPDLLRWLQDIASILGPDGRLMLVVPNKRYIFDFLRHVTTLEDVIADYAEGRTRPSPRALLEYRALATKFEGSITWNEEVDPSKLARVHRYEEGYWTAMEHATKDCEYFDGHVSVFTPYSFVQVISGLTGLGFLPLELERIEPSGFEFFALLKRCEAKDRIPERLAGLDQKAAELPFNLEDYYAAEFVWREPRLATQRSMASDDEVKRLRQAAAELEQIKGSASWRITKPLRFIRRFFH